MTMQATRETPRLQPHDLEAEQAVLGAILYDNEALAQAQELLTEADFYNSRHQQIFRAMGALAQDRTPIDLLTLGDRLEADGSLHAAGGRAAVAELVAAVATAVNVAQHAQIVRECSTLRQLIRLAAMIDERAYRKDHADKLLKDAERIVYQLACHWETRNFVLLRDLVRETLDYVEQAFKQGREVTGIPTGYRDLDRLLGGWQPSDLVVIAARPSMGKTSLALGTAVAAAQAGFRVGIVSLEMSRLQLGLRLHGMKAPVDIHALRTGQLPRDGWSRLAVAAEQLTGLNLWVDDTAVLTIEQLRWKARHLQAQHGLDLLVLDYLQLLQLPKAETRQQGIAEASRQLKLMAKELTIPILALSQLSRACELREDRRPVLADLRDSGAIEQDADVVLFIYREEVYNPETEEKGTAEILIRKHRNGAIGDRRLAFMERYARFADLAQDSQAVQGQA